MGYLWKCLFLFWREEEERDKEDKEEDEEMAPEDRFDIHHIHQYDDDFGDIIGEVEGAGRRGYHCF